MTIVQPIAIATTLAELRALTQQALLQLNGAEDGPVTIHIGQHGETHITTPATPDRWADPVNDAAGH